METVSTRAQTGEVAASLFDVPELIAGLGLVVSRTDQL